MSELFSAWEDRLELGELTDETVSTLSQMAYSPHWKGILLPQVVNHDHTLCPEYLLCAPLGVHFLIPPMGLLGGLHSDVKSKMLYIVLPIESNGV